VDKRAGKRSAFGKHAIQVNRPGAAVHDAGDVVPAIVEHADAGTDAYEITSDTDAKHQFADHDSPIETKGHAGNRGIDALHDPAREVPEAVGLIEYGEQSVRAKLGRVRFEPRIDRERGGRIDVRAARHADVR